MFAPHCPNAFGRGKRLSGLFACMLPTMGETITKEQVWAECNAVGELEVIHRLAPEGIWGNSVTQWRPLAQAWLREQNWKGKQATEAALNPGELAT